MAPPIDARWHSPVRLIRSEIDLLKSDPGGMASQIEGTISAAAAHRPDPEYYFQEVRPYVNALTAHFLRRHITPLYLRFFDPDVEIPLDLRELARGRFVDPFDAYQSAIRAAQLNAVRTIEEFFEGGDDLEGLEEDAVLWGQMGELLKTAFRRHDPRRYLSLLDSPLPAEMRPQTPQGRLITSGSDTALRFTHFFRNIGDMYAEGLKTDIAVQEERQKDPVGAFARLSTLGGSAQNLLPELMRLPIRHGGIALLQEVLTGKDEADLHVNPDFFDWTPHSTEVAMSAHYWARKGALVDPTATTTMCPAHSADIHFESGEKLNPAELLLEHALEGAQRYIFAPATGVQLEIERG